MMKKKILSLVVVMAMLLSFMPVIAQAETSGECGENLICSVFLILVAFASYRYIVRPWNIYYLWFIFRHIKFFIFFFCYFKLSASERNFFSLNISFVRYSPL